MARRRLSTLLARSLSHRHPPRRTRRSLLPTKLAGDLPSVSLVVCTRDRPHALDRLLRTVWIQQHLPAEVIVIDDGVLPGDRLAEWQRQAGEVGVGWVYRRKRVPGLTRSRNLGVDLARADVLQFVDDDLTLSRDFLSIVARTFAHPTARNVGGVECSLREPSMEAVGHRWFKLGYRLAGWWDATPTATHLRKRAWARGPLPPHTIDRPFLCGAAAYRREVFEFARFDEALGGYALGEDRQFSLRVAARYRLVRSLDAIATHNHDPAGRPDWHELGRQTVANYLHARRTALHDGPGDWLLTGWTVAWMLALHAAFSVVGSRQMHRQRLAGMCAELRRQALLAVLPPEDQAPAAVLDGPPDARRVAFLLTSLDAGGAEYVALDAAIDLRSRGHLPVIWTMKAGGELLTEALAAGVPVRLALQTDKYDASCAVRIARHCRQNQIDTLIAVGSGGDRMFWGVLSRLHHRHRVVVWAHDWPTRRQRTFERVNRLLYPFVERFVAVGQRHAEALAQVEGIPPRKISVVRNAVHPPTTSARSAARQALLELFPGPARPTKLVGIVANLRPIKRVDRFVRMAAELAKLRADVGFVIIGEGPDRRSIEELIAAADLAQRCVLAGRRARRDRLSAGLDVLTLTSQRECLPLAIIEAMHERVPVLAANYGSLDEVLSPRTGFVVAPEVLDEPAALALAVNHALQADTSALCDRAAEAVGNLRVSAVGDGLLAASPRRGAGG